MKSKKGAQGAAPKSEIEEVHGKLTKALLTALKKGDPSAALMQVARQFVRDQGITAGAPRVEAGTVEGIVEDLEDLEAAEFPSFPDQ